MSKVGCFGKELIFKISSNQVLTFNNFTKKVSGRWSDTAPIGRKPISEFNGSDLGEINFTMVFDVSLGVKPRKMIRNLERIVGLGIVAPLVIGNSRVGFNKWSIMEMSESWDVIMGNGEIASAKVNVKMKEYYYEKTKKKSSRVKGSRKYSLTGSKKTISYTVKKGDTLWGIAKKYLGKGKLYTEIYNANRDIIESTAKKHRKSGSSNGHWIYPGTVLKIEVKS